jgi:hypothetical protein
VTVSLGAWNERGFEGEAVDFTKDTAALPHRPRFFKVKGHAHNDPPERGSGGF